MASHADMAPEHHRGILRNVFLGANGLRSGWAISLFLVLVFAYGAVLLLIVQGRRVHVGGSDPVRLIVSEWTCFAAVLAATWTMSRIEQRPLAEYGLPVRAAFGGCFWQGATWALVLETVTLLTLAALGVFRFGPISTPLPLAIWSGALWALGCIGIALFEESLFRGYLLFTLARGTGFWVAGLAISGLFGVVHLLNRGQTWVGAAGIAFATLFLCLTVRRTGNLWFAFGLHAGLDWTQIFLFGVPQAQSPSDTILRSSMQGPIWLTGTDGNGGSVVFVVLILSTMMLFARLFPQARYPFHVTRSEERSDSG